MPDVEATLEFLSKLPMYETKKPYLYLPLKGQGLDPDETRLDNLEFETHEHIAVKDMRLDTSLSVDDCGFEFYHHETAFKTFGNPVDIDGYKEETERLLQERFAAVRVLTYEARLRRNESFGRREIDVYDKLLVEGPAKGAHVGKYLKPHLGVVLTLQMLPIHQAPISSRDIFPKKNRQCTCALASAFGSISEYALNLNDEGRLTAQAHGDH